MADAYDPYASDYDAIELAAREADASPLHFRALRIHDPTIRRRIPESDPLYSQAIQSIRDAWKRAADKAGLPADAMPTVLYVDVRSDGTPARRHVDHHTRLEDGTSLGSQVAQARARNNLRHIMGIVRELRRFRLAGVQSADILCLAANVPWNWTLGRPAREGDPRTHTIHRVGEKIEHQPIPWNEADVEVWWPEPQKKKARGFKPTAPAPF